MTEHTPQVPAEHTPQTFAEHTPRIRAERAPLIRADRVSKRYGSFTAVDTVSLEVSPGEIVGLLGANGAGKTTLIKILLGLALPTEGAVTAFGRLPDRTTRGRLGYVPQGMGLWPTLTVAENIAFASAAFRTPAPALEPALAEVEHRLVSAIGLGLQRQLAFTLALAHQPELLVLDEPTSGVEPLARARLWDAVHDRADQGVGVLVTTHYMQEAQQCDRSCSCPTAGPSPPAPNATSSAPPPPVRSRPPTGPTPSPPSTTPGCPSPSTAAGSASRTPRRTPSPAPSGRPASPPTSTRSRPRSRRP